MKYIPFVFILVLLTIGSCKESKKPASSTQAQVAEGPEVPGVPEDVMVRLMNQCTFIDYIFHDLPFSLSQAEDPSIDQNIAFIDYARPLGRIPKGCKPIARKFFQINGEIVYDVDVYLSNNCKFYVFVDKNNKPLYANHMTEAGVKFYTQVVQQAQSGPPQNQH